jgi:aldose 1-epimerase
VRRMNSFGLLGDGRSVESIVLGSESGLQVEILTYGAILKRLSYPVRGIRRELILGFDSLAAYEADKSYVGPVVGRFGNRIAHSRFTLDGKTFGVTANEGENHLHGGFEGFGKRLWRVLDVNEAGRAVLGYHSPAGEEGYPGNLDATIEFQASQDALSISLAARSDAATPVNLTYHPYFNVNAGRAPATDQLLRIPAAYYLPVRAGLIPTGEFAPVEGSAFDFRASRRLHPPPLATHPQLRLAGGYDHCWVLARNADCSCELTSSNRDLTLTMLGTGPGLQFYNGQYLSRAYPDIGSGIILEPQGLPDSPNHADFPASIARPDEAWTARIEYRLRTP